MSTGQTRRQALYFPAEMLAELQRESRRQDRSISWLIQQAWKIGRLELKRVPSTSDFLPEDGTGAGSHEESAVTAVAASGRNG